MSGASDLQDYLNLANDLLNGQLPKKVLPKALAQLAPLDENLLTQLAQHAEAASITEPQRGWAISQIADHAARDSHPMLQARAAWYLGRAYNDVGQPKLVKSTLSRARRQFERLHETGWVAACDWQLNVLSWTKPHFPSSTAQLKTALFNLEEAGLISFLPQCRMALIYAQILSEDFASAKENIERCEIIFRSKEDQLNLARCWLLHASWLRRQNEFDAAYAKMSAALALFEEFNAPLDAAKARYQTALWYFFSARNYEKAREFFNTAFATFMQHKIELWYAACHHGLGQLNVQEGNLTEANHHFQEAGKLFVRHRIQGMTGDNYLDSGQLEQMRGNLPKSLEYFKAAEKIYRAIGQERATANALTNHAHTSALLGHFQDALNDLELARKTFQKLGDRARLAGSCFYLAQIWTRLNEYTTAHEHLDKAEELIREINQSAMLGQIYNQRAVIFSLQTKNDEAITALKNALDISIEFGTEPQKAFSEHQLGEMLSRTGQTAEALTYLSSAENRFREMGMVMEQAASLTSLAYHYLHTPMPEDAQHTFANALEICRGLMPDIESRIYAGMGSLAETRHELPEALTHYHEAIKAIVKMRQSFWQPALAGSFLLTASTIINKSIQLATQLGNSDEALTFIESSKAQALAKQIASSIFTLTAIIPQELNVLWAEIQALQMQLRTTSFGAGSWLQSSEQIKQTRKQLVAHAQKYDQQLAQLEREAGQTFSLQQPEFQLLQFINDATLRLGTSWLALDYHITDTRLACTMLTTTGPIVWEAAINPRQRQALDLCARSQLGAFSLSPADMALLGTLLLPEMVRDYLNPAADTRLVIVPHRELHQIPWAALQPEGTDRALVQACVPVIVPSLQVLQLIWRRTNPQQMLDRQAGLLLGISDFQGSRPALPLIPAELDAIAQKAGRKSQVLLNTNATWSNLLALKNDSGLAGFGFFHIASHASHDTRTGRLSSIALHDREIWLDQLRELAPLPALVTLSACNGMQSLIYEGDEHVGLATTCLIAGANTITGSLWPVLDEAASTMMTRFYERFFAGESPAAALAKAQRVAIENGETLQHWASFICMGTA